MYNFKDVNNVERFLNEIGLGVELKVDDISTEILITNEFGDTDNFKDFNDLNNYANERLNCLIENELDKETLNELPYMVQMV